MTEPTFTHTFYRHVVKEDYHYDYEGIQSCVKAGSIVLDYSEAKEPYDNPTTYLVKSNKGYISCTYVPKEYIKVLKVTKTTTETVEEL